MIKILFFIENLQMGGAERVLCDLVNNMDQQVFDITVQSVWPSDAQQFLKKGIKYKCCYKKANGYSSLRMRLEAAAKILYSLHIRADYDIECAFLEFGPTKIIAGSTNRKSKKVAWIHCDLLKAGLNTNANNEKCVSWYQKFDRVVCVSEKVKESYETIFGKVPATKVLYNVVNDTEIRTKAGLIQEFTKRKKTVVSIGRLEKQKGYDRLLRVHKRLIDEGEDYDLWIIGKGEERENLEKYISENRLEDSVHLLGFHQNPYPFIQKADFLVCSSLYEGFSTFITEGLILGKAILTTECSGTREQLGDSEYGLIVENDETSLYEGMKKMLTEPELIQYYQEKAEQRGKIFSAKSLTEKVEGFFIDLMNQ